MMRATAKYMLQVGRAILVGWRADGNELEQAMRYAFGGVQGEVQPPGFLVARHHVVSDPAQISGFRPD